jgi:hypothetical protein
VTINGDDRRLASSSILLPLLVMAMTAAAPAAARAQPMLSDADLLRLKQRVASEVWVYRDRSKDAEPIHGFLTKLTDHEITVLVDRDEQTRDEETLPLESVWRIERRGDTIWDGFAAGALAGLIEWAIIISPEIRHGDVGAKLTSAFFGMGFMGCLGAGIDALAVGRTTVYDATRPQRRNGPAVAASADGRGAVVSWRVSF